MSEWIKVRNARHDGRLTNIQVSHIIDFYAAPLSTQRSERTRTYMELTGDITIAAQETVEEIEVLIDRAGTEAI